MDKVKAMIILLCLFLLRGSALGKSLSSVLHPAKPFRIAQSYVAQGQTTQEPDDDDDDEDDSDEDEDED